MNQSIPYDDDYTPPAPVLTVRIVGSGGGKRPKSETIQALVDTGADFTLLPLDLLQRINAPFIRSHRMRGLLGQSTPVDIYGVTVQVAHHTIKHIRAIAIRDNAEEPILGRNVLNELVMQLDGPNELLLLESLEPPPNKDTED